MGETNNVAALSIEAAGKRDECQNQDSGDASAHTVGQALYTAYTQWLLSAFHFINGQRFIRYRNLMGYHYGRQMYYVTWVLQYLTLIVANIGFILLAARSLKEISSEFSDSPLRLQICIVIAGVAFFTFAFFIPTMSAMRWWLVVSFFVTFTYIFILLFVLVNNGKSNKHRNYELKGSKTDKVFNSLGAISAAVVANAPCLLPEMQSTLRQPVVKNMRKALYVQFTVGLLFYYGIPIVGYWAYGSTASVYLPEQMSCVKWVKVFISPIHETLDTKFLKLEESMFSRENIKRRFFLRGFLFAFNIFVAAAFPFIGDFVNLIGSFALIPITFVFPSMVFIKVKANTARVKKKAWHWFNILLFSLVTVATTVAAVRFVIKDIHHYSFFTDV
ncbi:hypothetical protein WN944_013331 [Citrus x changshan-huyou]|uniref:Amino acid transporter transmembrane domain-containing protein n=1 Tax=Citrus x changshan-huyou TaxID=2935761 RepID=A0AAP0M6E5_9ROSI